MLPPDAIVFPKVGGAIATNKKRKITVPSCVDNNVMGLIPVSTQISSQYLALWLAGFDIYQFSNKANPPSITQGTVSAWPIPLPPLEEQHQIVAVLDEAFEGLSRTRAHAEANLRDARELFDAALRTVFSQFQSFPRAALAELSSKITKGSSPKWQGISYVDAPGVLFVTSENIGLNELNLSAPKYVEEAFNEKDQKSILSCGDVLTNIVGASIGRTAVFDKSDVANINQAVCLIRCDPNRLHNYFLSYLLNSPDYRDILHGAESNMARANLSLAFFRELQIHLPSLAVQLETTERLDALQSQFSLLEARYREKLTQIDALRQSLLQKAFAGELT